MRTGVSLRTRRSRLLAGAGVAALLLAVAGWVAWRELVRESATPATLQDAVDRFAAQDAAAQTLPPALRGYAPEPGVYVYETRGFEVSHVLGTRQHAYPLRTAITVAAAGGDCVRQRWDVLATRWDAALACRRPGGSWRLVSRSEGHAFAGHQDRRTYRCTLSSSDRPARLARGAHWHSSCTVEGTTTADRSTVIGPRMLRVAGRPVATVLLRARTRISGDTVGTGTTLTWIQPYTGLIVRRTIANDNSTDTLVGAVAYEERATLALSSPRPLR